MPLFKNNTRATRTGHYTDPARGTTIKRDVTLASAAVVGGRTQIRRALSPENWQGELWSHYKTIGELRFAVRWLANAVSRCTLFIGEATDSGAEPEPAETPDSESARSILHQLHAGQIGQAEMLRRMAIHLSVPGETFLVGMEPDPSQGIDEPRWYVASSSEVKISGDNIRLTLPETGTTVKLSAESSTIIRMWMPDAEEGFKVDSPVRATLPALREIKGLSDHIAATVDSRLAGAGVLAVPHSASAPSPASTDSGSTEPLHQDAFTASLMDAMLTSISDRDDASAVVPIVIKVPDEAIGKIQHITFATELSTSVSELRQDAITRFATGSDLPAEVITGTAAMNHWGAWALEESSIKLHVEPLVAVICDALTQHYLWPALRASGDPNPQRWVVWYDSAELVQRPNRSSEAQALYDQGALSLEALLRENGFDLTDAPTDAERARWLATRLVLAQPELLNSLYPVISGQSTAPATNSGPADPPDEPQGEPQENAEPPALAAAGGGAAGWWLCAVEQVALRALELAGKRLLSRSERDWRSAARNVHPWDVHTVASTRPHNTEHLDRLLASAYDTAHVNFADDPCVLEAVDTYCRNLLATGQPHRREYLATRLVESGCGPADLQGAAA